MFWKICVLSLDLTPFFVLQQVPPRTATYRMERGCARRSRARSSWNLKGSFLRTCIFRDWEESKSPPTWTCQRNKWKSGFRTAGWSTRRRARPPRGAPTAVASAQPATQTIQGRRMRNLSLRSLLRKRRRCHPSERNSPISTAGTSNATVMGYGITHPLGQKSPAWSLRRSFENVGCSSLPVQPTFKMKPVNIYRDILEHLTSCLPSIVWCILLSQGSSPRKLIIPSKCFLLLLDTPSLLVRLP